MFSKAVQHADALDRRRPAIPTGLARLDRRLGGLPPGHLIELSGGPSSGKATVALSSCLGLLAAGKAVCWIDGGLHFSPLAALEQGRRLDGLWVLRVAGGEAALRGADLLLGCPGAVALVVVDLPPGHRVREPQLVKLQRLAERSGAALLFLTERPATSPSLGSAVALRLHVRRAGDRLSIDVLRHKGGAPLSLEESSGGPDRLRVHSTL